MKDQIFSERKSTWKRVVLFILLGTVTLLSIFLIAFFISYSNMSKGTPDLISENNVPTTKEELQEMVSQLEDKVARLEADKENLEDQLDVYRQVSGGGTASPSSSPTPRATATPTRRATASPTPRSNVAPAATEQRTQQPPRSTPVPTPRPIVPNPDSVISNPQPYANPPAVSGSVYLPPSP